MNHSTDQLNAAIRSVKTLRRHAQQAGKARRHRYERRKVRGCIRLGHWDDDEML